MRIIKINFEKPDEKIIKQVAAVIKNGGTIIYPTDTVYGIGANALDKKAVEKVFKIKQRQKNKPLSVIVKDIKMAKKFARINFATEKILNKILPGPITVILKGSRNPLFSADLGVEDPSYSVIGKFNSIGIRIPDCEITKLLSSELKIPFTATSANISGEQASGKIQEIIKQFKNRKNKPDLILDAGDLPKSKPSTIVDLTGSKPKILRSGEISKEEIFKKIKL